MIGQTGAEHVLVLDDANPPTPGQPPCRSTTACLKGLRDGDTLVVWKLDRLGRDLRHLVNIVHDLTQRGVGLKVLTGQALSVTLV